MASAIDSDIDRLYQLPPGEFVAARNALAKNAGAHAADVRRLAKPSVPAWAVNQLYWKRRADYDALVKASTELRKAHRAVLGGNRGDIRETAKAHEAAVELALKSTLDLLRAEGHPATDATRHAIQTTLRALPVDEDPGRLTQALQPGGFEMLTGLAVAPVRQGRFGGQPQPAREPREKTKVAATRTGGKEDAVARQKAKDAAAKAARELRAAEHEAQREESEAARAGREADKAERALERAREALETAQQELEEAKRNAREAARARETTRRRAESAAAAVKRLRDAQAI